MTAKLLYDEPPVAVAPSAIRLFGASTAVVLQQLHYWTYQKLQTKPAERSQRNWDEDGTGPWLRESAKEIEGQTGIPRRTITRSLAGLVEQGILICREPRGFDRTKTYRLDYEALNRASAGLAHCSDWPMGVSRDDATSNSETPGHAHWPDRDMHWPNRDILKEEEISLQRSFTPTLFEGLSERQRKTLDLAVAVWSEAGHLHPDAKPMSARRVEIISEAMTWIDAVAETIKPTQVADWARVNPPAGLRSRDPLFDALAEMEGVNWSEWWWKPFRKADANRIATFASRLRTEVGATPDQVREKAKRYRERLPKDATLSAQSLNSWWQRLDLSAPSSGPRVVTVQHGGQQVQVLR